MATITGYTAARMKAIEDACIIAGGVVIDNLILTAKNGQTFNAGNVRGAQGVQGPQGIQGATGPQGPTGLGGLAVRSVGVNSAIPTGTVTYHSMTSEDFDQGSEHDNVTNPSRLTCTTAGIYLVIAQIEYPANATGVRSAGIQKGRATNVATTTIPAANGDSTRVPSSGLVSLAVGDYVEVYAFQTSGASLTTVGSNTFLSMTRVA